MLSNENTWTQGGEHHSQVPVVGWGDRSGGRDSRGWGDNEGIALGEIPNVDDGLMDAANHHDMCIPM